jgi:hypothetical protein
MITGLVVMVLSIPDEGDSLLGTVVHILFGIAVLGLGIYGMIHGLGLLGQG